MLLTEDEAKTKRCQETFAALDAFTTNGALVPVASTVTVTTGAYGHAIPTAPTHCIGSACMAWRWNLSGTALGYCGKAGKP